MNDYIKILKFNHDPYCWIFWENKETNKIQTRTICYDKEELKQMLDTAKTPGTYYNQLNPILKYNKND